MAKIIIARSYEKNFSVGQFQMEKFFASYSEELDETTEEFENGNLRHKLKQLSDQLYEWAKEDVFTAIRKRKQEIQDEKDKEATAAMEAEFKAQENINRLKRRANK